MRWLSLCAILAVGVGCAAAIADEAPSGKATYEKFCKSCHGVDGTGNAKMAKALKVAPEKLNLGPAASKPRDEVKKITLDGKDKMPAYAKKLKTEEVEPLIEYTLGLAQSCAPK